MELVLARQSVIIKCGLNASIMMGNYEYYYAGGLLCCLAGKKPELFIQPKELQKFLAPLLDAYEPKNEQESYLIKMLKEYKVPDEYDEQMTELLQMGLEEKQMWVR